MKTLYINKSGINIINVISTRMQSMFGGIMHLHTHKQPLEMYFLMHVSYIYQYMHTHKRKEVGQPYEK